MEGVNDALALRLRAGHRCPCNRHHSAVDEVMTGLFTAIALAAMMLGGGTVDLTGASIALVGLQLLFRMARPQHAPRGDIKFVVLALLPLAFGVLAEMAVLPVGQWSASAIGFGPLFCLGIVPLIAAAPLAATLLALRRGAPQSPSAAGAVAGFAAGGMAALIYSFHCNNDSPFYVAIWYLSAVAIVTVIGAGIGRVALRW